MQITDMTLCELRDAIARRDVSVAETAHAYLDRIRAVEGDVHAFITVNEQAADAEAAGGPLHGIPVALKDNLCVSGGRTTCASRMLADYVSPYSAAVWNKLQQAGCILLGKTNLDEFAMGSDTTTSFFGPTRNPHDLTRVPGGSSGGSAAAVAAGECPLAIGSDTGGSIRQPAAFCGVVGMKPTCGLVSRHGLVAFASSLDCVGPITRTVADNRLALRVLAGRDAFDTTTVNGPDCPCKPLHGLRIGIPRQMMEGIAAPIKAAVERAARNLTQRGAVITEVDLPALPHALPAYYILSSAEASGNLARFDGVRYGFAQAADDLEPRYTASRSDGFGDEVKRRILLGTFALSAGYWDAYYRRAQQVRTLVIRDFARIFEQVDCLIGPVAPTTAWKIGDMLSPLERYQADIHTVPASLAGLPALSVPCGRDAQGLPIGVQLIGPTFAENTLYGVGEAIEQGVK